MRLPRAVVTTLALASNCDEDKYARLVLSGGLNGANLPGIFGLRNQPSVQSTQKKKTQVRNSDLGPSPLHFRVFSAGVSLEIFLRLFPSKRTSSDFWIPPFHVAL